MVTGSKNGVMQIVSPVSHENVRCLQPQTEAGAPEWDFSSTNKTIKVETIKVLYGLEPLATNSPKNWHNQTRIVLLVTEFLRTLIYSTGHQMQAGMYIFWLAETRDNIHTSYKAKLSRHRTR